MSGRWEIDRTQGEQQCRYWRQCGYADGFVYVLEAPPLTAIKVGYTTLDVEARLAGLQTGCPYPLQVRCVIPAPRSLESWLHQYMRPIRTCGEWFDGPGVPAHLERIEGASVEIRVAHAGGPEAPAVEPFVAWIPRRIRKPPGKHQPVTVRHFDPSTLQAA